MKIRPVLLFTTLATASIFAQTGKVAMSPTEATAGKNITITITVNKVPSVGQTSISAILAPRDPKDNAGPYGVNLTQKPSDPRVYFVTTEIPINAKGVWFLRDTNMALPIVGVANSLETNHPEFTVKPVELTLPTSGRAEISVP